MNDVRSTGSDWYLAAEEKGRRKRARFPSGDLCERYFEKRKQTMQLLARYLFLQQTGARFVLCWRSTLILPVLHTRCGNKKLFFCEFISLILVESYPFRQKSRRFRIAEEKYLIAAEKGRERQRERERERRERERERERERDGNAARDVYDVPIEKNKKGKGTERAARRIDKRVLLD